MKKRKRISGILSGFMALILLLAVLTPCSLGQGLDLELVNYWTTKTKISAGDEFSLTMTIKNNAAESLTELYLVIDSESFFVKNQGSQIPITPSTLEAGGQTTFTVNLVYSGGSGQIPLSFNYSLGDEEGEVTHNIGMVTETESEPSASEPETTSNKAPVIKIADKTTQQVAAGGELNEKLQIKNMSSNSAKGVLISLSFEEVAAPFTFTAEQAFYITSLGSQSTRSIALNLKADNTAKAGTYPLKVDYQFTNTNGDSFTSSEILYIKVTTGNAPPRLVFDAQGGQGLKSGEPYSLVITVANRGQINAKDINIDLTGLNNEGIVLSHGGSRQYIDKLAAGAERNITYEIEPGSKVNDGSYPLTIKVSFKDESGADYSDTQDVFVSVGKGGSLNGAPKIIINRYESDPVIVKAGQNFVLHISFLNTHGGKTVQNIKVVLNVTESSSETGSVFTPVNASNTFYIDKIGPQQVAERSLEMYTIPDADPKTYSIDATLEYEDEDGTEFKTNELIGIPVKQITRMDVGDIQIYGEGFVGQPLPVSCEFYNTGRVTLRNLIVKLQGDFDVDGAAAFIGNLEPGSMEYYDGTIIPSEPGTLTGKVIFSFEDLSGELQTIEKEFTVQVMESMPMEQFPGKEMPGEMNAGRGFKIWYAIIPVVILAAAAFFIIRRRKKKKEEEMMLDD